MKILEREEAFKLWDQWWNELQKEWFKIEVLQDYSGEDSGPSLSAWLNGDEEKAISLMPGEMNEWVDMCQESPAQKRRFRIVTEPETPYTKWEIELYKQVNIPLAGESVHLAPAEKVKHLKIPNGDMMIFDQKRVARAHYSAEGKVEKTDFYEEGADKIDDFLLLRTELPKYASQVETK